MTNPARAQTCFVRILFAWVLALLPARAATVQFNRDIRPILSENCYQCHGPDKNHRKADLRLDEKEPLLKNLDEIVKRITTDDEDDHMPPAKTGKKLTSAQIDTFKQWIKDGAEYQGHWAYQK